MHDLPDLDLLRCFDHLHRERHLTRAAQVAHLSQPAMSRALARMRELFGDPLFVRTPTGMIPTPRADELAPKVRAVLDDARTLVSPPRFDPLTLARTFVIATTDFFEATLIPHLVSRIVLQAPQVAIQSRPVNDDTAAALRAGRVDVVVGVRPTLTADAIIGKLFSDEFVCAVRAKHPTVGRRLSLEQFVALPHLLIAPRGDPGGPVDAALAARGLSRKVVVRTHTFLSALAIVANTDMILTGPTRVLRPLAGSFGLRVLSPPLPIAGFTVSQAWHPRCHHDPAHAWFRTMIAEAARASADQPR